MANSRASALPTGRWASRASRIASPTLDPSGQILSGFRGQHGDAIFPQGAVGIPAGLQPGQVGHRQAAFARHRDRRSQRIGEPQFSGRKTHPLGQPPHHGAAEQRFSSRRFAQDRHSTANRKVEGRPVDERAGCPVDPQSPDLEQVDHPPISASGASSAMKLATLSESNVIPLRSAVSRTRLANALKSDTPESTETRPPSPSTTN